MTEFLNFIFNGANALPTALLLFVVLYWIIVIFGFIGTDFLDIDLDMDGDADFDADSDFDTSSADISWLNNALIFFNLGKIPLMIWLSFVVFPLWLIVVNVNGLFGFESFLPGLLVFIPALFVSLFLGKFFTWPFVKFFQKIDEDSKAKDIIGQVGTVLLDATHLRKGQAEVNYSGTFLRFYIQTREGIAVKKGQKVLFIQPVGKKGVYLIEPYEE